MYFLFSKAGKFKTSMARVPYNKLLTNLASSSRTGEYWPSVVSVRTSLRSVRTSTTSGQYSPVRPSRSVSKRLVVATTAKHPDSRSKISRYGWMQPTYMRSVSFWGKVTSGSRISASRSDLLKLPTGNRAEWSPIRMKKSYGFEFNLELIYTS